MWIAMTNDMNLAWRLGIILDTSTNQWGCHCNVNTKIATKIMYKAGWKHYHWKYIISVNWIIFFMLYHSFLYLNISNYHMNVYCKILLQMNDHQQTLSNKDINNMLNMIDIKQPQGKKLLYAIYPSSFVDNLHWCGIMDCDGEIRIKSLESER